MKTFYTLISASLIIAFTSSSCKQDIGSSSESVNKLEVAKKTLSESPNVGNANIYIDALKNQIASKNGDIKQYLIEGLRVAEEYKLGPVAVSFLMPLIKDYTNDQLYNQRLAKLSSALFDLGREDAASIMAQSYFKNAPTGQFVEPLRSKIGSELTPPEEKLTTMAKLVFENPDKYGINRKSAQRYVDACESFALAFPNSPDAPLYLYRGAEMARTLRTFTKALSIYDWISEKYPNYEKTPTTLFLKGFMLENELNNKEKAKEVYNDFISKYPKHELADDIEFLLSNIDKSDKEIMEMIESKNKATSEN